MPAASQWEWDRTPANPFGPFAGKEPKDPTQHEQAQLARIAKLEVLRAGYNGAADQLGDELADVIAQHVNEWRDALADEAAAASARYDQAISEAREAIKILGPARRGIEWLSDFRPSQAKTGTYHQFSGGRVRVKAAGSGNEELRGEYDVPGLLDVAALATAPLPKQQRDRVDV